MRKILTFWSGANIWGQVAFCTLYLNKRVNFGWIVQKQPPDVNSKFDKRFWLGDDHNMNWTLIQPLAFAGLVSAVVSGLAFWRGALSASGAVAALVVGICVVGLGGWEWGVLLGLFFISSSLLSRFKEDEKKPAAQNFAKGHQRDWGQVVANGGLGAGLALGSILLSTDVWFLIFIGVMAAVTADTWATEIGTLSRTPPRLITTGQPVMPGTSGAMSALGTLVSLIGGGVIGAAAGLLSEIPFGLALFLGSFGGLAGSLFDTFLGATVQGVYYSESKHKETEKKFDSHGRPNSLKRGWSWVSNDWVNFIASCGGGLVSLLLHTIWISI